MENKLPEGWEWKNLGEIGELISGVTYKSNEALDEPKENYMPILRANNINGEINFESLVYVPSSCVKEKQLIEENDILIAMSSGSKNIVGKTAQAKTEFFGSFGAFCGLFRCKNGTNKKYVGYYFKTPWYRNKISSLSRGANINNLRKENITSLNIPIPSLKTQQKIVSILEKAEETKKLRAQADELTQKLLQSVFLEMFEDPVENPKEWDEKSLEDLCSHIIDCPHSTPKYEESITPYPCIRTTELKNGYIDWSEMKYISEEGYKERIKRLAPVEGDIIYGREGTYGEAIRIPKNTNICLGQRVMLFRPNHNLCNSEFLWALVRSDGVYQQAIRKTSGSTVGHVNVNDIKKFTCFCPPLSLQDEFSSIVKSIEVLRENQQQSSQEINNLFDGFMQKAFTGELVS